MFSEEARNESPGTEGNISLEYSNEGCLVDSGHCVVLSLSVRCSIKDLPARMEEVTFVNFIGIDTFLTSEEQFKNNCEESIIKQHAGR
jgi:hypothetical protein